VHEYVYVLVLCVMNSWLCFCVCLSLIVFEEDALLLDDDKPLIVSGKRKQSRKNPAIKAPVLGSSCRWFRSFEALYKQFSEGQNFLFPCMEWRNHRTRKLLLKNLDSTHAPKFRSACEEKANLESYYEMWTNIFKLRWEIPLTEGKITISLKLPHFGLPPHAFVDSKSDPEIHALRNLAWAPNEFDVPCDECGYGYIADDVLQATVLQRYLFGDDSKDLTSLIKFSVRLHLNKKYADKMYNNTPPNGTFTMDLK